jgi:ABC-type lipoprotein export system ATPase subunit
MRLLVEELCKSYPGQAVLQDLHLQLEAGRVLAVCGASGTGKSTLLNLLGLLDQPDSGTITIDHVMVTNVQGRARNHARGRLIGFIFQGFHLLPEFDVRENILMAARCAGQRLNQELRNRTEHLLERVGLPGFGHRRVDQLSGGERQRVAICRALLLQPPLLLADEPTGNLDPRTGGRVLDCFLELAAEAGSSVVLVTHDNAVAKRCHDIRILADGRLHESTESPHHA